MPDSPKVIVIANTIAAGTAFSSIVTDLVLLVLRLLREDI